MNWQTITARGYLTRRQMEAIGEPVGEPFAGPAYGQKNDPTTALIGASVGSSLLGADAAGDAADTQAGAAREANALTQRQFDQMRSDLGSYRASGVAANSRLMQLLGLGKGTAFSENPAYLQIAQPIYDKYAAQYGGGDFNKVPDALREQAYAEATSAFNESPNPSDYGSLMQNFTGKDLESEPGYQFGLTEGQKGLDRRQLAGGNYLSGAALKAASRYNQDYASTKFDNAFNRDSANKNRIFSMLSGTAGQGQNAAAMTGTAGLNAAGTMGSNLIGAGNAQAAGQVGAANAISNGLGGAINAYQWNQLLGQNKTSGADWTTPGYGWNGGYSDY